MHNEEEDNIEYNVVTNHEEQYSIWPVGREIPRGWKDVGKSGKKKECLEKIYSLYSFFKNNNFFQYRQLKKLLL